ncbi:hypothetical protein DdX_10731 [Ditylenchus destructor]|uniref:Uncharacterized protein n=1 Tax=Ditylenchus destructor TaxID=166010 RepID=A0AAD4R500_9BILA|nr:hypothetical protein DdX_10731 [Ditylenchus destructor]
MEANCKQRKTAIRNKRPRNWVNTGRKAVSCQKAPESGLPNLVRNGFESNKGSPPLGRSGGSFLTAA